MRFVFGHKCCPPMSHMKQASPNGVATSEILIPVLAGLYLGFVLLASMAVGASGNCAHVTAGGDFLRSSGQPGGCGGRLVGSQRSEPKTFNPLTADDADSQ